MIYTLCLAAVLHCALAIPAIDLNQALHIQTDLDKENVPMEHIFGQFKRTFNKEYTVKDEPYRRAIFEQNVAYIKAHNTEYAKNKKTFTLGVNQFTDLLFSEYKDLYTNKIKERSADSPRATTYLSPANLLVEDNVDWRTKGYVTPVKNQGQCGSCWSFSTTGSLEGQHFKQTGKLVSLSEQQLVDCSGSFGNEGCNGGLMDQGFDYIKKFGIETEDEYPYHAKDEKCHINKSLSNAADVTGKVDLPEGSEAKLKEAVSQIGPISIAIDASHQSFQMYNSGVYVEPECSSTQLDHGVLIVGYGTEDSQDYWLVKNSWGPMWGDEGYIKMARNKDNQCGIASQASYPLV